MSKISTAKNKPPASPKKQEEGKSVLAGRATIAAKDVRRMQRVASTKGDGHTAKNSHIARIQRAYDMQNKPE
ncbi:hypothetical protein [Duganella sp. Leaf126]|uniref:hypothetical protein n=1 Tax=Duganella sp. Leaf126 TaxID=1736266 RepID=UPI000A692B12|nr:hypothetical protein [Duganella sp. Leaf126]